MNWTARGLILGGFLAAILLIGWQLAPRVESSQPNAEQLQGHQPLEISFSRSMDPVSAGAGFNLEPDIAGEVSWSDDSQTLTFTPLDIWPPGETITLDLSRGLRSKIWLPLLRREAYSWSVRPISLIYLWPADGNSNLYLVNPDSGQNEALTEYPAGVLDYSLSPDRESIFFSTAGEAGTSQILALDPVSEEVRQILDCDAGLCTAPSISADGSMLAHEYISREPGVLPGIRILNLEDGTITVLGEPDEYLEKPLWSPIGWLATYNQTRKGYQFWNPRTDETTFIPNQTGGDGSWSPDGRYFLVSEIVFVSDTLAPRHLQLIDLVEETTRDLSRGNFLEDLNPSFSPLGQRFAFSRKSLNPQDWTPGRQLWVMDLESETAFPLTDEVDFQHTSFAWHPEGDRLAYVRYNQAALSEPPEIWLIRASGEDPLRLIINGFAPDWIP